MNQPAWIALLGLAVTVNGLLAGASLDQSIEQLPARHRIGPRAYSEYSRASHLANGRFWLIPLGIGGPFLTITVAIWSRQFNLSAEASLTLLLAAGLAAAHLIATLKAAAINLTQWRAGIDDVNLAQILTRFERWQALRASLQFLTFAFTVWTLVAVAVSR